MWRSIRYKGQAYKRTIWQCKALGLQSTVSFFAEMQDGTRGKAAWGAEGIMVGLDCTKATCERGKRVPQQVQSHQLQVTPAGALQKSYQASASSKAPMVAIWLEKGGRSGSAALSLGAQCLHLPASPLLVLASTLYPVMLLSHYQSSLHPYDGLGRSTPCTQQGLGAVTRCYLWDLWESAAGIAHLKLKGYWRQGEGI